MFDLLTLTGKKKMWGNSCRVIHVSKDTHVGKLLPNSVEQQVNLHIHILN